MGNPAVGADHGLMSFGRYGSEYIVAGETGTDGEVYSSITCLESGSISIEQPKGDTSITMALTVGLTIYGYFTSVSVTSGKFLAYRG